MLIIAQLALSRKRSPDQPACTRSHPYRTSGTRVWYTTEHTTERVREVTVSIGKSTTHAGALALLITGMAAYPPAPAAEDLGASVSNTNATVTITASTRPEHVDPNPGTRMSTGTSAPVAKASVPAAAAASPHTYKITHRFGILANVDSVDNQQETTDFPKHKDTAKAVTAENLSTFPYRAVMFIATDVRNCSGWLFGPDVVLTAGHCLYDGGWATRVVVTARHADATTPFQTCGARRLYSTVGWTQHADDRYDYGAIKLDCRISDQIGWLGYGWSETSMASKPVTVIGYRLKRHGTTVDRLLESSEGTVTVQQAAEIFFDNATDMLCSGAPLIVGPLANAQVIGVHSTGCHEANGFHNCIIGDANPHAAFNAAVLITREVFQNMQAWKSTPVP